MIIVLGSVIVDEDNISEALEQSKVHVARSRSEPGCISHAVYQDHEVKGKLVFVEEWKDKESLDKHFQVPESVEFVKAVSRLAVEPPSMSIFSADPV